MLVDETLNSIRSRPFKVEILGHPPSVNQLYRVFGKRSIKSIQARAWDLRVHNIISRAALIHFKGVPLAELKGYPIKLEIHICRPSWRAKAKSKNHLYVRPDLTNFFKAAEDSLFRALGLDDSAVVEFIGKKVEEPGHDKTRLHLEFL